MSAISRHLGPQPDDPAVAVDEFLQPLLLLAARATSTAAQRVSASQLQALLVLHREGPLKLTKLAEGLDVIPSSATRLCDRLVAADLITRTTGAADRREVVLSLTTSGKRVIRQIRDQRLRELRGAMADLTDRERRGLLLGLGALAERFVADEPSGSAAHG